MVREVSPGERGFGGPGSAEQRGGEGGADRVGRRAGCRCSEAARWR